MWLFSQGRHILNHFVLNQSINKSILFLWNWEDKEIHYDHLFFNTKPEVIMQKKRKMYVSVIIIKGKGYDYACRKFRRAKGEFWGIPMSLSTQINISIFHFHIPTKTEKEELNK